jgi:hypothetical protein
MKRHSSQSILSRQGSRHAENIVAGGPILMAGKRQAAFMAESLVSRHLAISTFDMLEQKLGKVYSVEGRKRR